MSTADYSDVWAALVATAQALPELTTDEVWARIEQPPTERNVIGKAFAEANRRGILAGTERFVKSTRPESKGRRVQVWASTLHGEQGALFEAGST